MAILATMNSAAEAGAIVDTQAANHDNAYTPFAIEVIPNRDAYIMPFSIETALPAGDFWLHCYFKTANNQTAGTVDGHILEFVDGSGNIVARLDYENGQVRVEAQADTTVAGTAVSLTNTTLYEFDIRVTVTGASVVIDLFIDDPTGAGPADSSATAVNTVSGYTAPERVDFDFLSSADTLTFDFNYITEIIITDGEDTRGWRLAVLEPDAIGGETGWSGDFNELGSREAADRITSALADDRISSNVSAYGGAPTPTSIRAVAARAIAKQGTDPATVKTVNQFLRIASTNYDGADITFADGERRILYEVWDNNPNTTSPWGVADLASLEVGLHTGILESIDVQYQRAFAVMGATQDGIGLRYQRAFAVLGGPAGGIQVSEQELYAVMGSTPAGINVSEQQAFTVLGSTPAGLNVADQQIYVIVT